MFPKNTVNVATDKADISNGKFVEGGTFWENSPDQSMVIFNLRFLPGCLWITEKYM